MTENKTLGTPPTAFVIMSITTYQAHPLYRWRYARPDLSYGPSDISG